MASCCVCGKTGGADHHGHLVPAQVAIWSRVAASTGEIDQSISPITCASEPTTGITRCGPGRQFAGSPRPRKLLNAVRHRGEPAAAPPLRAMPHQGAPHASGGAGNGDADASSDRVIFMSSKKFFTPSNQLVWRGDWALPPGPGSHGTAPAAPSAPAQVDRGLHHGPAQQIAHAAAAHGFTPLPAAGTTCRSGFRAESSA